MTNEEDIQDYLNLKRGNNCSEDTIRNQNMVLTQFNQFIKGKPFKETTEKDVINFIQNRRQKGRALSSIKHYIIVIKVFYRWLYELPIHNYPKQVRNLNGGRNKNRFPITPNEMINEEDVAILLKHCTNFRDQAILMTLYESGARIGEFVNMDLKDLHFDNRGVVFVLRGKTGERRIRLILSVPYLQKWIEHHPRKSESRTPLWVALRKRRGEYQRLSDSMIYIMLQNLKKNSHFRKPVNPHNFRHSRATFLSQYLSDAKMRIFFGWSRGSNMIGRYTHLSGKDLDDDLARAR
jgi:site-specific recombinase XerD